MSPFLEAALITTGVGSVVTAVAADSMDKAPAATALLIWAAGVATALGVLWKFLHIGEIRTGIKNAVLAINGQPERPGFDPVPGLPDRMKQMEGHMHEVKGAMPSLAQALSDLAVTSTSNGEKIDKLDQRVTDHRRRNDQQAELLRSDLERRARDLEARLESRNHEVDEKLNHLAEDVFRAQTGRAILHELGIKIEPADETDPLTPK